MKRTEVCAWVLVGPTATGKSDVAGYLAARTGRSVCSADSMAVYRGMDIATAKPSLAMRQQTVYFGIDLAEPEEPFSVGRWLDAVRPAFRAEKTEPIVTGGTGLYINALLQGLDTPAKDDRALRDRAATMSLEQVQAEAKRAAPDAYSKLADRENPRRLIRLIEQSATASGPVRRSWMAEPPPIAGLFMERDLLHSRIEARVRAMYDGGLIEEARRLCDRSLSSTARQAIGYAEVFSLLRGELTREEAIRRTVIRTRRLAKRQMTWFRHQVRVEWIDAGRYPDLPSLAEAVQAVWEKQGPARLRGVES